MNESIIIGFSTPKTFNPFSALIKLVDGSKFSHAYLRVLDPYTKTWVVYQASGLKVNCISAESFDAAENVCAEFKIAVSAEKKLAAVRFAISMLGLPYGVMTIFGIGIVKLAACFRKRIENPFADGEKSMVCSKLVAYIIDDFVTDQDSIDPQVATPTDDYNFLLAKGYKPLNAA